MYKKILYIMLIAASVFVAGSVFAQGWGMYRDNSGFRTIGCGRNVGNGPGYMGRFGRLDAMKAELGLSDQQVKQIFDLGTQYREKYFENRYNADKLADLRVEHRKAIENVLTKEQLDKYNKAQNGYGRYCGNSGCGPVW